MRELPLSTDFCRALDPPQAACSYEFQCSPLVLHASHFIYTIDSPQYYKDQCHGRNKEIFFMKFLFPVLSFNSYLLSIMCHILCWALGSHQAEIWEGGRKSNRLDVDREVNLLRCNEYSGQMSDYVYSDYFAKLQFFGLASMRIIQKGFSFKSILWDLILRDFDLEDHVYMSSSANFNKFTGRF